MIIYTIYRCVNTINGKVYIGFDSNWPNRQKTHKYQTKNKNQHFYRALQKYNWEDFTWESIYQSKDREHCLKVMEPHFIKEYNSFNSGYNSTLGGEGSFGYKHTPEQRKKNSDKNSGINHVNYGKKLAESTKQKISKTNSGHNNGMFGKYTKVMVNGITFESNKSASEYYGVHNSTISSWIRKGKAYRV